MQSASTRTERDRTGHDIIITSSHLIQAHTLIDRWKVWDINHIIIDEIIRTGGITPFKIKKTLFNNGLKEHYLYPVRISYFNLLKTSTLDEDIVFILDDVLQYENTGYIVTKPRIKKDIDADDSRLSSQQKASLAKQEKTLNQWLPAVKVMIAVAMKCQEEGPKKRTRQELQAMSKGLGGELTAAQLDFLRDCLGGKHINVSGGPSIQG